MEQSDQNCNNREVSPIVVNAVRATCQNLNWLKLDPHTSTEIKEECQKMINTLYKEYDYYLPSFKI